MAVISNPNHSKVNVTLNGGVGLDDKIQYKRKSLSGIKSSSSNEDIVAVVKSIFSLQEFGTIDEIEREDNTSLSK